MDAERKDIVNTLSQPEIKDFALRSDIEYKIKNAEESIKARKKGNDLYFNKEHTDEDHKMLLYLYNKSIAYAPSGSKELMHAYNNRAYFLMHINKYNEALESLDKALQLTNSTKMKLHIHCQKVKCLAALGSSKKDDALKEIDQIFKESKISMDDKTSLSDLIQKTKSAVSSIKQFQPENKKFLHEKEACNQIVKDKENVDPFEFVQIKSTKNMGRGLYANTDFKTGDIVLVEKPCLIGPNFINQYVYCSQCLKVSWTGIPCESCHDFMFCSLECKNMAWEEYHKIDCSITPYLILCDPEIPKWIHLNLKFIIELMKGNQTIDELKMKLNISKNNQAFTTEIVNDDPDQKINLFNKLMNLSHDLPKPIVKLLNTYTVKTLICLVKYTSFFSVKLKDMQYNDLLNNGDFIFIGSLLLRLAKISALNSHSISSVTAVSNIAQFHHLAGKSTRGRGFCMGLISSMINNSCAPNIRRCFSDDMNYVFYAVEPISSGTELLDSYNNSFYESSLMNRRSRHTNFLCKCTACEKDWPPLIKEGVDQHFMEMKMRFEFRTFRTEMKFIEKVNPLIGNILDAKYRGKKNFINRDLIKKMANMMNEIAAVLPQPSLSRCMLLNVFDEIFEKYYGLTVPFDNICSTLK